MHQLDYNSLTPRYVLLSDFAGRQQVLALLAEHDLLLDDDVELSCLLSGSQGPVATGSLAGNVIKCVAVAPSLQGTGAASQLVSLLVSEAYSRGRSRLFVYTKPEYRSVFQEMGFASLAEVPCQVALLELPMGGLESFLQRLGPKALPGQPTTAALVMNCNPFTCGHRYLVEVAAAENELVHLFVLREEKSVFPFAARYRLVQQGVGDLRNVQVHDGGDYLISNATFPGYFIKAEQTRVDVQIKLDLTIFAQRIAPYLGISRRYVGTEPFSQVTNRYNQLMQQLLPASGILVREIPRVTNGPQPISASSVRQALSQGDFKLVRQLVPATTYAYLCSAEAEPIITRLRQST